MRSPFNRWLLVLNYFFSTFQICSDVGSYLLALCCYIWWVISCCKQQLCQKNKQTHCLCNFWSNDTGGYTFLNTLRPRQNGRHFADDTFKCIFLNENVWIVSKISLNFDPKGSIDDITALVQIMAWRLIGDKPLSEPMLIRFTDAYLRH